MTVEFVSKCAAIVSRSVLVLYVELNTLNFNKVRKVAAFFRRIFSLAGF